MNNPLNSELTKLHSQQRLAEAEQYRKHAVRTQNPLTNALSSVLNSLAQRPQNASAQPDEQERLAWLAEEA